MKGKVLLISVFSFFIFYLLSFIFSELSFAHPPSSIEVKVMNEVVKIKVYHHAVNPAQHYIKYVNVYVDGEWILKQRFFKQGNGEYQEAVVIIPSLKSKDVLLVTAHCNKQGKSDKTLIIP